MLSHLRGKIKEVNKQQKDAEAPGSNNYGVTNHYNCVHKKEVSIAS